MHQFIERFSVYWFLVPVFKAKNFSVMFLGMFKKFEKQTISFVLPVCLSICTEQPSSQWMDFHEI
jgi:hypothetical protein